MNFDKRDLDNYITGHYGEDQFRNEDTGENDWPEPPDNEDCPYHCDAPFESRAEARAYLAKLSTVWKRLPAEGKQIACDLIIAPAYVRAAVEGR